MAAVGRRADAGAGPAGFLLVDKPSGPTSHDVVAQVRRLAGTRRVGHAGTLDPMASGLLVVGVGYATRLLTFVVGSGKVYRASIRLGWSTTTDDAEGEPVGDVGDVSGLTDPRVREALAGFVGPLLQVPSSVSAIKVAGRRAYDIVRSGGTVDLPARPVTIDRIDVSRVVRVSGDRPALDIEAEVACSSGTYIRALARDLGRTLGVGGHLTALRRLEVGSFGLREAASPDTLAAEGVTRRLLSPAQAARRILPALQLTAEHALSLGHGRTVRLPAGSTPDGRVAALDPSGRLIGIAEVAEDHVHCVVNMPPVAGAAAVTPATASTTGGREL